MITLDTGALVARIEALEATVARLAAARNIAEPPTFTRREAATYARIGLSSLDETIRRGELRAHHIGRRVVLRRADVEAWLAGGGR